MLSGRGAGDQCPILVVTLALPDSDKGPVLAEKLLKVRGGGVCTCPKIAIFSPNCCPASTQIDSFHRR